MTHVDALFLHGQLAQLMLLYIMTLSGSQWNYHFVHCTPLCCFLGCYVCKYFQFWITLQSLKEASYFTLQRAYHFDVMLA
jgi:hypothetical protein